MAPVANRHAPTGQKARIGPYLLTKPLGETPLAARWLALHERDHSSHVAYGFAVHRTLPERARFEEAIRRLRPLDNSHLLKIEDLVWDSAHRPWLVTPYTGDVDGVRTLARLLREKGGQMEPLEAERAIEQVLEAVEHTHGAGIRHGPIGLDEVLVDRHGRLIVELYGLAWVLRDHPETGVELVRDEVRSVAQIGYQLITGLRAEEPMIPAGRLVKRLDPRWEAWLAEGLDPASGFDTASRAMSRLPSRREVDEPRQPMVAVRGMLERFRTTRD